MISVVWLKSPQEGTRSPPGRAYSCFTVYKKQCNVLLSWEITNPTHIISTNTKNKYIFFQKKMLAKLLLLSAMAMNVAVEAKFTKSSELTSSYNFEQYLMESGKKYANPKEYASREKIFNENMALIKNHNSNSASYKLGVNMFTDRTKDELKSSFGANKHALRKTLKGAKEAKGLPTEPSERKAIMDKLPKSFDWRDHNVVTPVKDQGHCGSCWAHAAVETIESMLAINTGVLTEISQQELVACMPNDDECGGTGGCEGATAELAFDYMAEYGLPELWTYSYEMNTYHFDVTNSNGACNRDLTYAGVEAAPRVVTGDGYELLPRNSYDDLMYTIANVGPVAVNVDASDWHAYEGGVFNGCSQNDVDINHVVQLVGYGTCPETKQDYWLVRNSWTSSWGVDGYIKIAREDGYCGYDAHNMDGVGCNYNPTNVTVCGMCGIMYDSVYPTNTRLWEA